MNRKEERGIFTRRHPPFYITSRLDLSAARRGDACSPPLAAPPCAEDESCRLWFQDRPGRSTCSWPSHRQLDAGEERRGGRCTTYDVRRKYVSTTQEASLPNPLFHRRSGSPPGGAGLSLAPAVATDRCEMPWGALTIPRAIGRRSQSPSSSAVVSKRRTISSLMRRSAQHTEATALWRDGRTGGHRQEHTAPLAPASAT